MEKNEKKIELSKRLSAVAGMVSLGGCVADVGCDHGFVSIYLVQNGISEQVIAMDINQGPLERAREHVEAFGLKAYIQLRLSDGLSRVSVQDKVTTAVIAGMGGKLMEKIISQAVQRDLIIPEYVISPQSDQASVRKFLREAEYVVIEERMICEDGKYYPMMKAVYRGEKVPFVNYEDELSDAFGPLLLYQKDPVLLQYLNKEIHKFEDIVKRMRQVGKTDLAVMEKLALYKRAAALFREG